VGKPSSKVTFVGVHDRRTDFLVFRKKVLMTEDLDEDYLPDAMNYFRYGSPPSVDKRRNLPFKISFVNYG
jgi:hypothetical protein